MGACVQKWEPNFPIGKQRAVVSCWPEVYALLKKSAENQEKAGRIAPQTSKMVRRRKKENS
jgi:hypothetical protein